MTPNTQAKKDKLVSMLRSLNNDEGSENGD